jgi:hypothetical protein
MRFVGVPLIAAIASMNIVAAKADDVWGAVSIADDGGFAAAWNRPTRTDALNDVKRRCRENSTLPDSCSDAWAANGAWIAGVKCEYSKRRIGMTRSGQSAKQAIENAYKSSINGGAYAKEDCKLKVLIAGDGSHLTYASPRSDTPGAP